MSESFDRLCQIMDRLRDPGGCPWDREQTLTTLSPYLVEEAHEVTDAVASGEPAKLCEELRESMHGRLSTARIAGARPSTPGVVASASGSYT